MSAVWWEIGLISLVLLVLGVILIRRPVEEDEDEQELPGSRESGRHRPQ